MTDNKESDNESEDKELKKDCKDQQESVSEEEMAEIAGVPEQEATEFIEQDSPVSVMTKKNHNINQLHTDQAE